MERQTRTTCSVIAIIVAASASAHAQSHPQDEDITTARTFALGGRAEATSSSTAAMFGNPAMLSATHGYHTDAFALYDPTVNRWALGSAIVDSTRSVVAAGLSYLYSTVTNGNENWSAHDTRLNVSLAFTNWLGIGGAIRYLNTTGAPPALNGGSLTPTAYQGFTFDAGLYVRPVPWLVFSATGRNLNNPDSTAAPIGLGFGAAVTPMSMLTIVADGLLDFRMTGTTRGRYSGGVEVMIADRFPVRAGYSYDDIRGNQAIFGGVGYVDQNVAVEFSLRQGIVPDLQTTMMLSLRYFYRGSM